MLIQIGNTDKIKRKLGESNIPECQWFAHNKWQGKQNKYGEKVEEMMKKGNKMREEGKQGRIHG